MADTKISALTAATTPLAGTEVLPIVQSGTTKQVSVANLTAGRAVSAASLSLTTTPLAVTSGGTGLSSIAQGDLLYGSAANTLSALAKNTTASRYLSNSGTSNNPAWAQVDLTNGVTGTLPVGNGGTGTATAFTSGSIVYAGASGVYSQDNANLFYNAATGALGIGTNSIRASSKLDVRGNILTLGANGTYYGTISYDAGTGYLSLAAESGGGLKFGAGTTVYQQIHTSGGVSIGDTTDPGAGNLRLGTGNLVQGTAAKGINFTANSAAAGKTSQLLNWYEEGTWTPVISDGTNNATMGASNSGTYTRIGRMVTVIGYVQMSSKGSISGALRMTGLPFTVGTVYSGASVGFADGLAVTAGVTIGMYTAVSTTYTLLQKFSATTGSTALLASDTTNNGQFIFSLSYFV